MTKNEKKVSKLLSEKQLDEVVGGVTTDVITSTTPNNSGYHLRALGDAKANAIYSVSFFSRNGMYGAVGVKQAPGVNGGEPYFSRAELKKAGKDKIPMNTIISVLNSRGYEVI